MPIRTDYIAGDPLPAEDVNSMSSAILNNEHNVFELALQNYFGSLFTPVNGLFFDGFSDTLKTAVTSGVEVQTGNRRVLLNESSGGEGGDGSLTVPSGTTTINTTKTRITALASSGQKDITVNSVTGFAIGNEIFVHQSQGTGAGLYEIAKITNIVGSVITVENNLANSYQATGAQVVKIPQYSAVTVQSGGILTAGAWDKTTDVGGILAFRCSGTVNVQGGGKIDMKGRGFAGGALGATENSTSFQGDSSTGDGVTSTSANGSGGGGGGFNAGLGAGGGGGGHAVAGANGTVVSGSPPVGTGGSVQGEADLTTIFMGAGGGGGGRGAGTGASTAGANGGGIIWIVASTITVSGSIDGRGDTASGATVSSPHGSGGGGAGGSIALKASTLTLGSSLVDASGGAGGTTGNGAGGNGGAGRIAVVGTTITGTTTPTAGTLDDTVQGVKLSTFFWQSIKTAFQESFDYVRLWFVRNFSARFNLFASIAQGATSLQVETDISNKIKNGDTIDIYTSNNIVRERKTVNSVSPPVLDGSGGTITFDGQYVIHKFSGNGNFVLNTTRDVEWLVVGGGGGGGRQPDDVASSGGGGGGRVLSGTDISLGASTYPIVVGAGGRGAGNSGQPDGTGETGGTSSFNAHSAVGGSGGQNPNGGASGSGNAGGSGADGNKGGGGGGDSAVGGNASGTTAGAGGAGTSNSITGVATFYGGGGGGGAFSAGGQTRGLGGVGGGGNGVNGNGSGGSDGEDGKGGGGGGSGATSQSTDGGDGVVIVRYLNSTPVATTYGFTPAVSNASGFGTTAFVERVDVKPQISLVDTGSADNFQNMTYLKSRVDFTNNEVEDEYEITVTDKEDLKVKLLLSRQDSTLTVYAKRLGVGLN